MDREEKISEQEARKLIGQLRREEKILLRALLLEFKQAQEDTQKAG